MRQTTGETDKCYLAEFLALQVRDEGPQAGEAGVDALHAAPLVAVGDLPSDALLILLHGLGGRGQRGPGEAAREDNCQLVLRGSHLQRHAVTSNQM